MSSNKLKSPIFLDNAAATPTDPLVKKEMFKGMDFFGNPPSFNDVGRKARKKLEEARQAIARFLGARSDEVIFTSSGSEANNMAILGLARMISSRREIITTPIEHPSVLKPLKFLEKDGFKATYPKIGSDGLVNLKDLENRLNRRTLLVSIMYANNEIGTIQPIKRIAKVIKEYKRNKFKINETIFPLFHTDACQATGYLDMNVNNLGVDLMTFNGAKIYGPRGTGVLYVRRGTLLQPLIYGGDQEHGLRAGTENLPAIVGLAKAVSLIDGKEGQRLAELRDYFFEKISRLTPDAKINGPLGQNRLPNNVHISIPDLDSENLLLELDKYGIYASSGSACTARSVEPSHVLRAIEVGRKYLNGALRFSLGRQTTKKDIDYVLKVLPKIVKELRDRYGD